MRKRILIVLSSLFMVMGLAAIFTTGSAHASPARPSVLPMAVGSGSQYAYTTDPWGLINAWNGGPWVKNYYGGLPTTPNDDFTLISLSPTVYHALKFTGTGGNVGRCIGDAYNDPGDARASLGKCGTGGTGEDWGVDMTYGGSGCPLGWYWFHDVHWGGYLGPASNTNGVNMYLNKPDKYCFGEYGPA